jgi:signal transduction histidine kinase
MEDGPGLIHHYHLALVAVSIIVAVLASYTALMFAGRIAASRNGVRLGWLLGGHFQIAQERAIRAEQALRASEERFRSMVASTHEWDRESRRAETTKSDFVSFVSHQLRTPLTGVSWMLELAAEAPGLSPEVAGYVGEARDSTHRLIRLVNDLLDVSRLESGRLSIQRENLRLDELVGRVVHELQPLVDDKQLHLTVARLASEPTVCADSQLMRQAVTNLLSNAIKYTPSGGTIAVTLTMRDGVVACVIRDTGIGVPKEAQARLFEKFYRADNAVLVESEGTGLGLSVVRLVAEHFGGRVWCESERGEGALFTLELPAVTATPRPRSSPPAFTPFHD